LRSFPSPSSRPKKKAPSLAAMGMVGVSAVVFGATLVDVSRRHPEWRVFPEPEPLKADTGRDLVAVTVGLGLTFLTIHAFTRWVTAYIDYGKLMSLEELEQTYQ
jgi:hypothetical protein